MNPFLIINANYKTHTALYDILVSHSQSVAKKARDIAEKHPELHIDTQFVSEAAMLHDIGIFLTNAPEIACHGENRYIEHGYLGADLLRKEGFPKHALVCERHTGTGLSLDQIQQQNLPLPHRDMRPVSIEEQLICFADKFFSKTKLNQEIPIATIRQQLSKFGADSVAQFDSWSALFL